MKSKFNLRKKSENQQQSEQERNNSQTIPEGFIQQYNIANSIIISEFQNCDIETPQGRNALKHLLLESGVQREVFSCFGLVVNEPRPGKEVDDIPMEKLAAILKNSGVFKDSTGIFIRKGVIALIDWILSESDEMPELVFNTTAQIKHGTKDMSQLMEALTDQGKIGIERNTQYSYGSGNPKTGEYNSYLCDYSENIEILAKTTADDGRILYVPVMEQLNAKLINEDEKYLNGLNTMYDNGRNSFTLEELYTDGLNGGNKKLRPGVDELTKMLQRIQLYRSIDIVIKEYDSKKKKQHHYKMTKLVNADILTNDMITGAEIKDIYHFRINLLSEPVLLTHAKDINQLFVFPAKWNDTAKIAKVGSSEDKNSNKGRQTNRKYQIEDYVRRWLYIQNDYIPKKQTTSVKKTLILDTMYKKLTWNKPATTRAKEDRQIIINFLEYTKTLPDKEKLPFEVESYTEKSQSSGRGRPRIIGIEIALKGRENTKESAPAP